MTEADVASTKAKVAVLLQEDEIANVVYIIGSAAGEMILLCVVIGDGVLGTAVTAASTHIYNYSTDRKTAG